MLPETTCWGIPPQNVQLPHSFQSMIGGVWKNARWILIEVFPFHFVFCMKNSDFLIIASQTSWPACWPSYAMNALCPSLRQRYVVRVPEKNELPHVARSTRSKTSRPSKLYNAWLWLAQAIISLLAEPCSSEYAWSGARPQIQGVQHSTVGYPVSRW